MKKIIVLISVSVFLFSACKTSKDASKQAESQYTTDYTTAPKIFTVPGSTDDEDTDNSTYTETTVVPEPAVKKETTSAIVDEKPISVRKEQVSFTEAADQTKNEDNTFFVILGSFSQLDNAKTYRSALIMEGFSPIILHSETGYYRVCVDSYQNEYEARQRVSDIRQVFPQYADAWLLIKE